MTHSFRTATAMVALGLGALSMAPTVQAQTVVDFTVAEYSSKTGPYFQEVATAFEAANPDIKINIQVVPWDTLLQRLTTDVAGGTSPDISIIGTRWLLDFASQGVAEPIDSYLTPEFKGTFIDTFMSPGIIDGKIMGLPVAASARAMMSTWTSTMPQVLLRRRLGMSFMQLRRRSRRCPIRSLLVCKARKSRPTPISTIRSGPMAATF